MPARQITPRSYIEKSLAEAIERRVRKIVTTLSYVGEQCLSEARENHGYIDRTGNLTSSIGYVVLRDGVRVSGSDFRQISSGGEGSESGKKFLDSLVSQSGGGITLIMVAGMNYASYVETNYNVLISSELLMERLVPELMRKLGFEKV